MRRKVALDATGDGAKPLADAAKRSVSTAARWMKVMVILIVDPVVMERIDYLLLITRKNLKRRECHSSLCLLASSIRLFFFFLVACFFIHAHIFSLRFFTRKGAQQLQLDRFFFFFLSLDFYPNTSLTDNEAFNLMMRLYLEVQQYCTCYSSVLY